MAASLTGILQEEGTQLDTHYAHAVRHDLY